MRTITIIGAGQAGLLLGIGLLHHGYNVRLVSDRTPDAIANGSILSTQCMFGSALAGERSLALNLWDGTCPPVEGMHLRIAGPDRAPALAWGARLDQRAQSVDQRLKMPAWIEQFTHRGGNLIVAQAGVDDLERYARDSDLVVVAAGKGEISALFERNDAHSPYREPQRELAACCVHGYAPQQPYDGVVANLIPGVGEVFVMPGLAASGPCHFIALLAIPGGPLDCWSDVRDTTEHIARMKLVLRHWLPWEYDRGQHMEATDARAAIRGRITPVVRHPVATLPSGAPVLGLADAVVLNDPITGQGANNAAKSAAIYLRRIVDRDALPIDARWMQATFDAAWNETQWATLWTNAMLQPPPPHVMALMGAAAEQPQVARWFANGFNNPRDLFPFLTDPAAAEQLIGEALLAA
jgi:hypothetical protein